MGGNTLFIDPYNQVFLLHVWRKTCEYHVRSPSKGYDIYTY